MSTDTMDDAMPMPDPRTSRRLFQMGSTGLIVAIVGLAYASQLDSLLTVMGVVMLILGAVPALNWARRAETHFPVFEMFLLTTIPFYAVPLLRGQQVTLQFPSAAIWQAVMAMIVFQASAIVAFERTRGNAIHSRTLTTSLLPASAQRYAQTGIWLNSVYLYVASFTEVIPRELNIPLRAMFFGISTVSLFIEMRRWGARQLSQTECYVIAFNVMLQLSFLFSQLYLIDGISLLLLALLGYVSTSRRLPLVALAFIVPIIAVLHSGKSAMREKYWEHGYSKPALTDLPAYFEEWVDHGLTPTAEADPEASALAGRLLERASLFQMLCLVTERTPEPFPYLAGASYADIPAQLVPSILWPNKPSSLLSNILLAIHYRLVAVNDTTSVSIAFGMIAEAYANFGLLGCAGLGMLLGYAYKRISRAAVGCPQFCAIGLFTILLAAWSFQAEQIFATWFVSLIQATMVVIALPVAVRKFFNPA